MIKQLTKKKDANWKCSKCGVYHVLSTNIDGHPASCINCGGLGTLEPIKKRALTAREEKTVGIKKSSIEGLISSGTSYTKEVKCVVCGKPSVVLQDTLSPFLCIHCGLARSGFIRSMGFAKDMDPTKDRPKDKTGKYQPHLVCSSLTEAVARVREYGVKKYKGEDGWKQQTPMDYMDAVGRHYDKCRNDPRARDDESGLLHICQIATDAMFIIDMLVKEGVDIAAMKEPDGGQ